MGKIHELQKRYFIHWNPILQFNLSSQSDNPEQREQALKDWDNLTGAAIGLKRYDQLIDNLIKTLDDPLASKTLQARAIFCLLWHDLRMGYTDQIRGPLIAKHLGISGLPQYLIAEKKQIPWNQVPHELEQFVIEIIILSLQHLKKDDEELKQWYGFQLILVGGQKENSLALEFLPEHFKVFEIWEKFLIRQDIPEQIKRPANRLLMDCLKTTIASHLDEARTPICRFTSMVYNRLTDRQRGMGYHPAILRDQICFVFRFCEDFPEFGKSVRVYLPQEAYYWILAALDQLDHATPAYKTTQQRLVEFFIAGGVHAPNTETGVKALRRMREIALRNNWLNPAIALGLALGMSTVELEPASTEAMAQ